MTCIVFKVIIFNSDMSNCFKAKIRKAQRNKKM